MTCKSILRAIIIYCISIAAGLILPLSLHPAVYAAAPDFEVIADGDPWYNELFPVVNKWSSAILARDIDALVSYALPEQKEKIRDDLKNKKSDLYRLFYDDKWNRRTGGRAFHEILKNAKRLRIVLQRDKSLKEMSNGVDVFYFDESRVRLNFPLDIKDIEHGRLQKELDAGRIIYMLFFKENGQWYANYELF